MLTACATHHNANASAMTPLHACMLLASTHHAALEMPRARWLPKRRRECQSYGSDPGLSKPAHPPTHTQEQKRRPNRAICAQRADCLWQLRQQAYDVRPQVFVHQVLLPPQLQQHLGNQGLHMHTTHLMPTNVTQGPCAWQSNSSRS